MANKIAAKPKLSNNGNATLGIRIPVDLRASLISIADRRGEYLNQVVHKALAQYVKADARRQK